MLKCGPWQLAPGKKSFPRREMFFAKDQADYFEGKE